MVSSSGVDRTHSAECESKASSLYVEVNLVPRSHTEANLSDRIAMRTSTGLVGTISLAYVEQKLAVFGIILDPVVPEIAMGTARTLAKMDRQNAQLTRIGMSLKENQSQGVGEQ